MDLKFRFTLFVSFFVFYRIDNDIDMDVTHEIEQKAANSKIWIGA